LVREWINPTQPFNLVIYSLLNSIIQQWTTDNRAWRSGTRHNRSVFLQSVILGSILVPLGPMIEQVQQTQPQFSWLFCNLLWHMPIFGPVILSCIYMTKP